MSKDLFWNGWFRVFLLALIYVLAGFVEPCDNEPGCHAPQEFKHDQR